MKSVALWRQYLTVNKVCPVMSLDFRYNVVKLKCRSTALLGFQRSPDLIHEIAQAYRSVLVVFVFSRPTTRYGDVLLDNISPSFRYEEHDSRRPQWEGKPLLR